MLLSELLSAGCFAHGQSMCGGVVFHYDLFFFFFQVQIWDLVFHKELDFVQMEQ